MNRRLLVLFCLIFLIIVTVYGPFVLKGGFGPSDDLALVYNSDAGFASLLSSFLTRESSASRPLTAIIYSIIFPIFRDSPRPYIILQLSTWFASVVLLSRIVKLMSGKLSAVFFIVLGAMPIFSSAVIFSPVMIGNTFSIFFWALSLIYLQKYYFGRERLNFWLSHLFLLAGLLSTEIIMPLLLFNALLPLILEKNCKPQELLNRTLVGLKYVLPVIVLMVLFFIFKVFITDIYTSPFGNHSIYGLSISTKSILQSIYYFFTLIFEIPSMLIETIPFLVSQRIALVFVLIAVFFIYISIFKSDNWIGLYSSEEKGRASDFFKLVIVGILCCSIIFFLSGYPAVTFGHYNKMMMPTHFLGTILICSFFSKMLKRKWIIPIIIFFSLWSSSMIIQLDNFIDSWKIRKIVLEDCSRKINLNNLGKDPYLIASVPFFTQNNYNNEHVFWLSWDFSSGLKIFGTEKYISSFPLCWQTLTNKDYYPLHNINTFLSELPQDPNIWFYEYNMKNQQSEFQNLENLDDLNRRLADFKSNKSNYHKIIMRQKVRMRLKSLAFDLNIFSLY